MAAKRHHHMDKARRDESMGMKRRMRDEGHYAGEYARRTQEMEDAGMIHNDMRAIANLPQEVMIKPYSNRESYLPENLDDTIKGVDHQIDVLDDGKRNKGLYPKKV
jgi:hypothetical protein